MDSDECERALEAAEKRVTKLERLILKIAFGSQLCLDNPQWRLSEEICREIRDIVTQYWDPVPPIRNLPFVESARIYNEETPPECLNCSRQCPNDCPFDKEESK